MYREILISRGFALISVSTDINAKIFL